MAEHGAGPPGDESGIRPEVVQAIFSALADMDPASSRRSRRTGSGSPLPRVSRPTGSTSQHAREPRSAETPARGHAGADRRPQVLRAQLARPGRRPQPGTGLTAAGAPMRTNGGPGHSIIFELL